MSYIVENGRLMQLSVTGIQSFNEAESGCPKRWHYKNVLGRKEPYKEWHSKGDAVQSQIDHFLATGENVLGRIALPGLPLLPPPGPDLIIDLGLNNEPRPKPGPDGRKVNFFPREQSLLRAADVPFIGFLDMVNPRGDTVGGKGEPIHDGFVEVIDHKTAKSFDYNYERLEDETWVKKGGMLSSTQMAGYAIFALEVTGDDHVRLSHNAYRTDEKLSPAALKATEVVSASAARAHWSTVVEPLVEKMKSVAGTQNEADVEGNLSACDSFGGCPHRDYCSAFKNQNVVARMKQMGLLSNRKAAAPVNGTAAVPPSNTPWITPTSGAVAAPPPPPAAPPPPPAAPAAPAASKFAVVDVIPAGQARQGQQYLVRNVLTMFLCSTNGKQSFAPLAGGTPILTDDNELVSLPGGAAAPAPAAPPPAPAAATFLPPPVQAPPPPAPVAPAPVMAAPPPPPAVAAPPPPVAMAPPPPPAAPAAEAPKRGRGRPTKAEQAAKAAAEAAAQPPPPAAVPPGQTIAVAQAAQGITLCLNTIPSGPFTDLSGYVYETTAQLEEQFDVEDIRAAQHDHPLAFSKWKGALAAMVKAEPPPPGVYVAFTRGDEFTEIVAAALSSMCAPGQFFRGV